MNDSLEFLRKHLASILRSGGLPVAIQREVADSYAYYYVDAEGGVLYGGYASPAVHLEELSLVDLAYLVERGVRGEEALEIAEQIHTEWSREPIRLEDLMREAEEGFPDEDLGFS